MTWWQDVYGDPCRECGTGWSGAEYGVHVADTLRSWSERLAAAVWTLRRATADWCEVVQDAHAAGVLVRHRSRGALTAHAVALRNRHGVLHHLWDVRRLAA